MRMFNEYFSENACCYYYIINLFAYRILMSKLKTVLHVCVCLCFFFLTENKLKISNIKRKINLFPIINIEFSFFFKTSSRQEFDKKIFFQLLLHLNRINLCIVIINISRYHAVSVQMIWHKLKSIYYFP